MNDYAFGNYICALRRKAGLSQSELASKLGVTDKAVSKRENGRSKPATLLRLRRADRIRTGFTGEIVHTIQQRDFPEV